MANLARKVYPFKFLDPYEQKDKDLFFGREEEINTLYQMVFQTNILLLYGASGTGKTSLIQCGFANKFKSYDWLDISVRRGGNINNSLERALKDVEGDIETEADEDKTAGESASDLEPATELARSFKAIYLNYFRPIYLIFDQFEELYIHGNKEEQQLFIEKILEILKLKQPIKIIFIIRDEYLGHLYDFEKAVPQLLSKKLRLEPMNLEKIIEIIEGISQNERSVVTFKQAEKKGIAQLIFEKVKGKENKLSIQLPYLQVFFDKLYLKITGDEDRQKEAEITKDSINSLNEIEDVLREFLEEQVVRISKELSRQGTTVPTETLWKILSPFATLEGTKESVAIDNLVNNLKDIHPQLINVAVDAFVNGRILRNTDANQYELAHDSLAKKIAEKRSDDEIALLEVKRLIKGHASLNEETKEMFSEKQLSFIAPMLGKLNLTEVENRLIIESQQTLKQQKEKEKKRLRLIIAGLSIIVVVMVLLTTWALQQSKEAVKSAQAAHKNAELAGRALDDLKKSQIIAKAKELEGYGNDYYAHGESEMALDSYRNALDTLKNYPTDDLYTELKHLISLCRR